MSMIGHPVCFRVPEEHHTETVKGQDGDGKDIVVKGSVHHAERREFAGMITHTLHVGGHDVHEIVIHVPGRPVPIYVQDIREGRGPGTLTLIGPSRSKPAE